MAFQKRVNRGYKQTDDEHAIWKELAEKLNLSVNDTLSVAQDVLDAVVDCGLSTRKPQRLPDELRRRLRPEWNDNKTVGEKP